jgi:hypothetical protein
MLISIDLHYLGFQLQVKTWHSFVNIPFYHEETVTLQLWADKSYENN